MFNIHKKNYLLVVKSHQDEQDLNAEVKLLESLLFKATSLEAVSLCTEIADLNKYKHITSPEKVKMSLLNFSSEKVYVFKICKN